VTAVLTESELFVYLRDFYMPDLERQNDEYDCFDCISKNSGMYIELKSRLKHYDNLLIEQIKYDALIKGARELDLDPWYINSTPEGIWGFNLSEVEPQWDFKIMPATTEFENKDKKIKTVAFLNVNEGMAL
jgi:hypothetical protein